MTNLLNHSFLFTPVTNVASVTPVWDSVVKSFINEHDVTNNSKATYKSALLLFLSYLNDRHITQPQRSDVIAYKRMLLLDVQQGKRSNLTVCSYLNAIRSFFRYTHNAGIYPNVANGVNSPRHTTEHKKQHLTTDKISELLTYYSEQVGTEAKRNYAIVNLLIRTGIRTAELININIDDIKFLGGKRVLFIQGKGHNEKDDYVILTDKTFAPIHDYLQARGVVPVNSPLFVSHSNRTNGQRLTTRTIRNVCRTGLDAIGLDDDHIFTVHSLRHTTAVCILEAGGGLEQVQRQLRHKSVNTSRIYVESFNKMHDLCNINSALDNLI